MDRIVGGKFKLGRKIGCGSFGEIYLGEWPIPLFPDPLFLPPSLPRVGLLAALLLLGFTVVICYCP